MKVFLQHEGFYALWSANLPYKAAQKTGSILRHSGM